MHTLVLHFSGEFKLLMKNIFFTVGPSKIYPRVDVYAREAFEQEIPSLSHRSAEFQDLYKTAIDALRRLLKIPDTHRIFFLTSGTEGMERVVQNCVGTTSFHFIDGAFSKKFLNTSLAYRKNTLSRAVHSLKDFEAPLPKEAEVVCFTHNETSTGMVVPPEVLYRIKKENPRALVAVDTVSSMPHADFDYSLLDCVFFSVQKGFGLPAGLGVLVVSPQAFQKHEALLAGGFSIGYHHSFPELEKYGTDHQTHETPNVLDIYLFGKVLADMERLGIDSVREGINRRAERLYEYFGAHPERFRLVQTEPALRSPTTIVTEVIGGSVALVAGLKKKHIVVGAGYGADKEKHIRIANFPAHTDEDIARLIAALSASLS